MKRQIPLNLAISPQARFSTFVFSSNRKLHPILQQFSENPGHTSTAMLLIGPSGIGKSHLLQAATFTAWQAGRQAIYLSVAEADETLLEGLGDYQFVAIDDLQCIAGNRAFEQRLLVLIDSIRAQGGALLFASQEKPACGPFALPDLVTRLLWSSTYPVQSLDETGKLKLMKSVVEARGLSYDDGFAEYVLNRHARDVPTLMRLLNKLDDEAWVAKKRLSVNFVRQVMKES